MAGVLVGIGTLHFVRPSDFDRLIPAQLGSPRAWTYGSGVAELGVAGLLARRRTARLGGWVALVLFAAVWPGNWKAALDGGAPPFENPVAAWARVPFQIPLFVWAWRIAHREARPDPANGFKDA